MAHRLAPHAERDLDDICLYVAKESGSIEIANRLIDTITDRFFFLSGFPYIGRSREEDFGPGYRTLAVGDYVIVYCVENEDTLILRVVHGRRDLEGFSAIHKFPQRVISRPISARSDAMVHCEQRVCRNQVICARRG